MHTVAVAPGRVGTRVLYGALAALLLAGLLFEVVKHSGGYGQLAAFGIGPDLALFLGVGAHLAHGQLHPRAVPLYNLVHRFWLPSALVVAASLHLVPRGFVVGGLAWCFHVALDRTVGYGLRTRDGFQRS